MESRSFADRCKQVFGGLVAAFLLLPVPAYAAITWGSTTWTPSNGAFSLEENSPSTFSLSLPLSGATQTITFTNTVTTGTGQGLNATLLDFDRFGFTGGETLQITIQVGGNVTGGQSSTNGLIYDSGASNMFSSSIPGTLTTFNDNLSHNITITMVFAGSGGWTVSSTPLQIAFGQS